jgi:hypothetical protein
MSPGLEVVANPDAIEASVLGLNREIKQLTRPELFRRSLVSQLQTMICHEKVSL